MIRNKEYSTGFPQRLEILEKLNENGNKVMKKTWNMKIDHKSWNFVICLGILPILTPDFTNLCNCCFGLESLYFPTFFHKMSRVENLSRDRIERRQWKSYGNILEIIFSKSLGTLYKTLTLTLTKISLLIPVTNSTCRVECTFYLTNTLNHTA